MVLLALLLMAVGAFFLLSLALVGLCEAPWPILLGLLLLGLYGLQRFSAENDRLANVLPLVSPLQKQANQTGLSSAESKTSDSDDLVYRGVHYRRSESPQAPSSQAEVPQAEEHSQNSDDGANTQSILLEGVYRGKHWQRLLQRTVSSTTVAKATELTYRGHKVQASSAVSETQTKAGAESHSSSPEEG